MKKRLAVIIPALNEEDLIAHAINDIPLRIRGIGRIDIIIVNDGSTDRTGDIVRKMGIKHIVEFNKNRGLGEAFKAGISYALGLGPDVIIQTDADMQYRGDEIERVIRPILEERADAVIGDRQLKKIKGYPLYKLISQLLGSFLAGVLLRKKVKDATSGFVALTRDAAGTLADNLQNSYSYTPEMLCVFAAKRLRFFFVPINIRYPTRKSRLITSKLFYAKDFFSTLFRCLRTAY